MYCLIKRGASQSASPSPSLCYKTLEENPAFARDLNLFLVKDEKAQRGTPFKFTILVFPSPRKWFLPLPVQNIFMKKPSTLFCLPRLCRYCYVLCPTNPKSLNKDLKCKM